MLCGVLPPEIAKPVRDIILNPPSTNPFQELKREIFNRTAVSDKKNVRLLSEERLGDKKPSEFLQRLKE